MAGTGALEFWVHEAGGASPLGTVVSGKVFAGTLRVGDEFRRAVVAESTHAVSLRVSQLALYGTLVDAVDAGLSARVVLSGQGGELLGHEVLLYRS